MPSLKEVRNRIASVNSTQQITKAMKMVSAAKLRRAQDRAMKIRPYAEKLNGILQNIAASLEDGADNVYAEERELKRLLIVVVTSDRGLAGAFNANIVKAANALIEEKYSNLYQANKVDFICIGKKGAEAITKRGESANLEYQGLFQNLSFDTARGASEYVMNAYLTGKYDRVEVIYNEFKNVATQIIRTEQFLPIKGQALSAVKHSATEVDYIFEPSKEEIVKELIPKSLKVQFYKYLLESNASEHGARMTAMDKATENAKEMLKALKLTYNRSRQAAITKEILEIVGGAEALNN
ncbi:ATP synthase F1 subunit gamma [Cytophaga hutchinsonii]|uniref:ATP synthase gamma chain n=1 Tax=Cytophaga hutchinsonii (strain ATCC 33406 / DSM 1761 / CIP 103989 / NBRC 15051 / NCIMB 9469 / D465) TaxID=269798 RepID=ATPG_CYTH3|nr:ATP synthase F1 subunit gamma [Cytophaga hutchinsonii]Q11YP0.1 RecName: Full=ATP synthase gamma chain; AltName: Full=ATP synthase F1 sector gamma subunit; AltName: Full=F-ATPase gamma subunit [Cytophaga hutchinsonii ATCC 33406]ABG57476.1 ATP synthase F1 subcomplex gamma subunit [Cytophaga hutchinsonii ATCC 33406]SFW98297.1 ATP synthase F1 subcomplex gamma subunit [Cytophaga hutchinsonii ATCC 33406]